MMLKSLASCCALLLVSAACGGHSDVPGIPVGSSGTDNRPGATTGQHSSGGTTGTHHDTNPSTGTGGSGGDGGVPNKPAEIAGANIRLMSNELFDGYLTDANGRALYMFAQDSAGAEKTTCLGDCANDWPPYDARTIVPGRGLNLSDLSRFHRDDGRWQLTFKGHPLYYNADEEGTTEVTADDTNGRWFVARNYLAFFHNRMDVAPDINSSNTPLFNTPFLTDGHGRTVYIYKTDTPAVGVGDPTSSCDATCLMKWPIWPAKDTLDTTVLPSNIEPQDFSSYKRADGSEQLMFRGWPLYYFKDDDLPGEAAGHNQGAWRAIDPVNFGTDTPAP